MLLLLVMGMLEVLVVLVVLEELVVVVGGIFERVKYKYNKIPKKNWRQNKSKKPLDRVKHPPLL